MQSGVGWCYLDTAVGSEDAVSPVQRHSDQHPSRWKMLEAYAVEHRQAGSALLFQCTYVFLKPLCSKRHALCTGLVQLQAVLRV